MHSSCETATYQKEIISYWIKELGLSFIVGIGFLVAACLLIYLIYWLCLLKIAIIIILIIGAILIALGIGGLIVEIFR